MINKDRIEYYMKCFGDDIEVEVGEWVGDLMWEG
jgi:hypothetical protein